MIKNIFSDIPSDLSNEVFEKIGGNEKITIERIISKGHRSPEDGWYDQDNDEWVLVLQGSATIEYENKASQTLVTGDFVEILANEKHRVSWSDPDKETIWLAVHY